MLAACATPIAPTGGPDDTTPPALVASSPAAGAVRVASGEIVLAFSERLDPTGVRAVQVTPESETPPEVEIRGREILITLDSLRDATTYVVTVSTDLRDTRRVALRQPITLAFATGDVLDRGRITGRVRTPEAGAAASGVAVWAYAADSTDTRPDPRQRPPDYQTESGSDGTFSLDYLREGPYAVVAVLDANRNRRADPGEAFAVPLQPLAIADTLGADLLLLTLGVVDSLAPTPQRARGLSRSRLAVRFDERVRLLTVDKDPWVVADSASGERVPVAASYVDPISPQEVRFTTTRPLAKGPWRLSLTREGVVADSAGNRVAPFDIIAAVPDREDETTASFAGFLPESQAPADSAFTLLPEQRPGLAFSTPPEALPEVTVTSGGAPVEVAFSSTDDRVVSLDLDPSLRAFTVAIASGDSTLQRRYRRPAPRETGEIIGRAVGADRVIVEALPASGDPYRTITDSTGAFRLAGLLPGDYRLRFIGDADGDGAWSPGALAPYAPPDLLVFTSDPQTVRARFETDVGEIRLDGTPPEAPPLAPSPGGEGAP